MIALPAAVIALTPLRPIGPTPAEPPADPPAETERAEAEPGEPCVLAD